MCECVCVYELTLGCHLEAFAPKWTVQIALLSAHQRSERGITKNKQMPFLSLSSWVTKVASNFSLSTWEACWFTIKINKTLYLNIRANVLYFGVCGRCVYCVCLCMRTCVQASIVCVIYTCVALLPATASDDVSTAASDLLRWAVSQSFSGKSDWKHVDLYP